MPYIRMGVYLCAALYAAWYLTRFALSKPQAGLKHPSLFTLLRLGAGAAGLGLGITAGVFIAAFVMTAPLGRSNPQSTPLMRLRGEESRLGADFKSYEHFSPRLVDSLLIAEDPRFFEHQGFDLRNTLYAVELNTRLGFGSYGGSTLTQQLARTLYLDPRKTMTRKYLELCIALTMEQFLSKERILELYLNYAEWGLNMWGAVQASREYFGKDPIDLTDPEIAVLLSLLPAPRRLTPDNFMDDPAIYRRYRRLRGWQTHYPAVP